VIAQLPLLLALAGTALTGVAIFAPARNAANGPTVSFAPPLARWPADEPAAPASTAGVSPTDAWPLSVPPLRASEPTWPELVDPSARACDAAGRLALVEALAIVRAPWAEAILRQAHGEEPDTQVRAALEAALNG
jgi:hypothetical protein